MRGVYQRISKTGATTWYIHASVGGVHSYLGTFPSVEVACRRLAEARAKAPPMRRPHRFGHIYRQRALFGAQVRINNRRFFLGLYSSRAEAEQSLDSFRQVLPGLVSRAN